MSKYIECEIVRSTSAADTIEMLRRIFSRNGLPDVLVSDNATNFMASEFKDFLAANSIEHMTPPPYSPSSNGQAERSVEVIKRLLDKNLQGSLQTRLSNALLYYRNVPHSVTKIAPSVALNSRNYVTLREKMNPCYVPKLKEDPKYIPALELGDEVLALDLTQRKEKWQNATVIEVSGLNTYKVQVTELDTVWRRHKHQLRLIKRSTHTQNDVTSETSSSSSGTVDSNVTTARRRSPRLKKTNVSN